MNKSQAKPDYSSIGETIRYFRKLRGISLQKLSRQIGVSHQQLSKYEKGRDGMRVDVLLLIAAGLGVPVILLIEPNSSSAKGIDNLVSSEYYDDILTIARNIHLISSKPVVGHLVSMSHSLVAVTNEIR